ncbi:ubiquinol-cytochrome c reductase iron-sulfur subunit [Gaoshiqia sp. Z1-71]|uniref:QcrA and Rieske domain-containing protein n=1 Tax=Gaoshiqia hydrogeniformans TaxID=3290090 RepID=UPI003BF91F00
MDRKDFFKNCGFACLGASVFPVLLQGCSGVKILSANIVGSDLVVPVSDFDSSKGNQNDFRKYIILQNDQLQYPLCVYRFSENEYSALWMRCTHQGTELQVFGDKLQCPAHGSEFSTKGQVQNGPADQPLRTFPVTKVNDQLIISLK